MTSQAEYLAGFLDGDGSVSMKRPTKTVPNTFPTVSFSQSCDSQPPPELVRIQERWGGRLQKKESPKKATHRQAWKLSISKKRDVLRILLVLQSNCIVKLAQVKDSIAFLEHGTQADAELYASRIHELKKQYHEVGIDPVRLTDAYIAGLFAADGSVGVYKRHQVKVSITQSGCPRLLQQIRANICAGSVSKQGRLTFQCRPECRAFLDRISPFLSGQKAPQVELVRDLLQVFLIHSLILIYIPPCTLC
jgi:hypothetical protein